MKTLRCIILTTFVFLLAACSSPTPAPTATSTATLVPTPTETLTPTPLPTLTPTPTDTPTVTPTAPPSATPTITLTFTLTPMPTPEAIRLINLTIINNSGQPITLKLESIDQPGTGYELSVLSGETKTFKIAPGKYKRTTWACGNRMSSGSLNISGNSKMIFIPCK